MDEGDSLDHIPVRPLAVRFLANASEALCRGLGAPEGYPCLGFITADSDDPLYIALDEATKAADHLKTEMQFTSYRKKVYPKYRDLYEYCEDGYVAMVPEQLSDIKLEGTIQHHCVGGYIDRHANGSTIILFIRRTMRPAIPLYTVEISPGGTLRQIQGYHNEESNKPTPDADSFVKRWLAEIRRRLAKDKNKKKKEEAA